MNPDGKARAQGRRVPAAARAADRRVPVPADHRPHALPLPHPDQDRPGAAAAGRRARRVGRDVGRPTPPTGWAEGDLLGCATPRGKVGPGCGSAASGRAWCSCRSTTATGTPPDGRDAGRAGRAANELTITDWDPASKQPLFKTAAAQVQRVGRGGRRPSPAPTTTGVRPVAAVVPRRRAAEAALATEAEVAHEDRTGHRGAAPGGERPGAELLQISDRQRPTTRSSTSRRDIARWSAEHVPSSPGSARTTAGPRPGADGRSPHAGAYAKGQSTLLGRRHEPGLLLLADLRACAQGGRRASRWTGSCSPRPPRRVKDTELLEVAERCHPRDAAADVAGLGRDGRRRRRRPCWWRTESQPSTPVLACGSPTGLLCGEPRWRR